MIKYSELQTVLDDIRVSSVLGKSDRRFQLLEYLLKEEIEGRGDHLKAYAIGIDVLDRGSDFDPSTDSIVRVEVGRLRDALTLFYAKYAVPEHPVIRIPKGTYRPEIMMPLDVVSPDENQNQQVRQRALFGLMKPYFITQITILVALLGLVGFLFWDDIYRHRGEDIKASERHINPDAIAVSLAPYTNLSPDEVDTNIITGFFNELKVALSRNRALLLLDNIDAENSTGSVVPDYQVSGSVRKTEDTIRIVTKLHDNVTGALIWANLNQFDVPTTGIERDEIVSTVASELNPRLLSASKELLIDRDPESLSPWQLYVLATWVPGISKSTLEWQSERANLAQLALIKDPNFGPAHSVLADKLIYLASVNPPSNTEATLARSRFHRQRALELSPRDANVLFNIAVSQWHEGMIKESTMMLERVLELNPAHEMAQFLSRTFPYTCSPPSEEILNEAIAFDQSLSSDNPARWVTLTFIGMLHINRGDFSKALTAEERAYQIYHTPDTVMRYASLLNHLGRSDEAASLIKSQKMNWPNISPAHFSDTTIPRRCIQSPDAASMLDLYRDLTEAMADKIEY